MTTRLRYIPLHEASEGMLLGAALTLIEHGVVTFRLPAGHELTESNLRQLAVHHGEFVCIEETDTRSDDEREQQWAMDEARLARIFRLADLSQPALAGLYQAILNFRKS